MSLELNHVIAEILSRSPPNAPRVAIAPEVLSAAQLELKDFLAVTMSDADEKTINDALVLARAQLTGVAVAGGEAVPPLALTTAMLDLAALTPPVWVPADVIEAAKMEQALALANATAPTPLQREAIARAYTKVEALLPAAKTAPVVTKPATPTTGPKITVPMLGNAVAEARKANLTILPAWQSAVDLEAGLIASGMTPTPAQQTTLDDAMAAVKAVLPK